MNVIRSCMMTAVLGVLMVVSIEASPADTDGLFDRHLRGHIPRARSARLPSSTETDVVELRDARRVEHVLRKVDAFLRRNDLQSALRLTQSALRNQPSVRALRAALAVILERMGRDEEAQDAWSHLLSLDSDDSFGLVSLARSYINRGVRLQDAERLLQRRLDRNPDDARAIDTVGWYWYKKGELGRATERFERARKLDPELAEPVYHLGLVALRRDDIARALMSFQEVVRLQPTHDKALISLGLLFEKLGERRKAVDYLSRALLLVPDDGPVAQQITETIRSIDSLWRPSDLPSVSPSFPGLPTQFLPVAERTPEPHQDLTEPRTDSSAGREHSALSSGQSRPTSHDLRETPRRLDLSADSVAREVAEESVSSEAIREAVGVSRGLVRRDLVSTHLRIGKLYREHGLLRDAAGQFQTVINLSPLSPQARRAKYHLEAIADFADLPSDEKIPIFIEVGEALFRQTDYENAAAQYKRVLLLEPTHALAHKNLAYTYLRQGLDSTAWTHVNESLSSDPENAEALALKGYILARRRNFQAARDAYAAAANLVKPSSVLGRYAREMAEKMALFTDLR